MRLLSLSLSLWLVSSGHALDYSCAGVEADLSPGVSLPAGDIHLTPSSAPVTLTCHLNPRHSQFLSGVNSSLLAFISNSTHQMDSVVIDDTSIQAKFKPESPGVTDLACVIRLADRDQGVCAQKLYVGFPPDEPVVKFQCVSSDWEDLNCTWEEPYNPIPTNYNVTFFAGRGRHQIPRHCPELQEGLARRQQLHQCYLTLQTEPHYRQTASQYIFYFNATNPLNEKGRITRKTVTNYQIVRPGPAVVQVTSQSQHSLQVNWNVSRGMVNFPPGLRQSLHFKCEWDSDWTEVDTSHLDTTAQHFNLTLTNSASISPFTECNISVWMSTPDSFPLLSSEPVYVLGKTRPAPPSRPPNTTMAGFETLDLGGDTRAVIVYWQRLGRREQFGPDFEYVVRDITADVAPTEVRTSHARFESLSAATQTISIFSTNSEGSSSQYSVVDIPASEDIKDLQPRSVTKIYRAGEELLVSWLAPFSALPVSNYTLLRCQSDSGRDSPHQCDGDIQWETLPAHTTNLSLSLDSQSVVQIAVAANYKSLSSGLQWTTCTISNRAGTVSRVTEVTVGEGEVATSQLRVRWSLYCSKMGNIVNSFLVSVCGEAGDCSLTTAKAGEESVLVSGLSPFTSYTTTVSVLETDTDQPGLPSPPVTFTTAPASPSSPVLNINSSVTASEVELTWEPPVKLNGELCDYEISVDQSQAQRVTESRVVLDSLLSYTSYEVRLAACVRTRAGECVLCGQPRLTTVTTSIGQPAAPPSPAVRPLNMSALAVTWHKDFQLGAPEVLLWRLKLTSKEEDGEGKVLTVAGEMLALTVDIDSLEENSACQEAEQSNRFFYVSLQAVVRDNLTEFSSPWSSRQEVLVPCHQTIPVLSVLLYIFIFLTLIALMAGLYRVIIWYRRKIVLMNKLRVSLDNRELGPITQTEMTWVQSRPEEVEEQAGGLVGPADQDSESEDGVGPGLRTVLLRTHKDSSSQDSGVSTQPPPSPQRDQTDSSSGGTSQQLERSVSGYVSMSSQQQQEVSSRTVMAPTSASSPSPGYISLGQVQPLSLPPSQPSTTHYVKFGIEGLAVLQDSGGGQSGQYVKQENPHYCQYSYV